MKRYKDTSGGKKERKVNLKKFKLNLVIGHSLTIIDNVIDYIKLIITISLIDKISLVFSDSEN